MRSAREHLRQKGVTQRERRDVVDLERLEEVHEGGRVEPVEVAGPRESLGALARTSAVPGPSTQPRPAEPVMSHPSKGAGSPV